ncbi:MAG: hypothetical protein MN733_28115, partial [Nitrososphaera sp.]|nr:hypothetical protein [Nitrososphaera sp.]
MRTQSLDTHPDVERFQIERISQTKAAQRLSWVRSLSQTAIQLSRRAISRANPELSEEEVNLIFVKLHYGTDLAVRLRKHLNHRNMMKSPDLLVAIQPIVKAFEQLGI